MTIKQKEAHLRNPRPRKKPTLKEAKFAFKYVELDGNGTGAALQSYNTTNKQSAAQIASDNLEKPIVQETIKELLEEAGLDIKKLNVWSEKSIKANLEQGKPSQAAGVSHLQFLYKLHNAVPSQKKVTMHLGIKFPASNKSFDEILNSGTKTATDLQNMIADMKNK